MADFYTAYDTEKGRVILQIPTDATSDDMALLQDMLNLIKATLEKRRSPQTDCKTCKHNGEYAYCRLCGRPGEDNYEPQTDCPWK